MTPKDPGTDFNPRHRILGAIILVGAAVIFVPMILSEREPPAATVAPSPAVVEGEAVPTKIVVTDLRRPAPEPAKPAPAPAPRPAESGPPGAAEPVKPAVAPVAKAAASNPPPVAAPETVRPVPKPDSGWMVQVGTFANAENAGRLEEKLRQQGHAVRTERVTLDSGKAVRLRVGPFRDKALALKAQAQIQKEIGVQGVVLAYP